MIRFLLTRLCLSAPTFVGILLVSFLIIRLVPGDPVEVRLGERGLASAQLELLRAQLGLDRPVWLQFVDYAHKALQGDLGVSLVTRVPVLTEFRTLIPATLELNLVAILFAIALGLPAGIVAAVQRGTMVDFGVMGAALGGYSMPIFWWGILLILLFSVQLGWTPVSGRLDIVYDIPSITGFMLIDTLLTGDLRAFLSALSHLVLPTVALGTIPLAVIARMTRSSMLEVLEAEYVRAARAKGLSPFRVVVVHALRNALIPVLTVIGLQVGAMIGGAILTESIFAWPGIASWLIEAVGRRDYPVLQGGVLLVAVLVMLINFTVDVLYGVLDPRVRS